MAWRKVTEADLESALSGAEIEAFRRSATEADPVESQIRQVCAFVRGCIRSGGSKVRMSPSEDFLPESLVSPAMDWLRYRLLTRQSLAVNESRTRAYEAAEKLFDELRKGDYIPESDGDGTEAGPEKALSPLAENTEPAHLLE